MRAASLKTHPRRVLLSPRPRCSCHLRAAWISDRIATGNGSFSQRRRGSVRGYKVLIPRWCAHCSVTGGTHPVYRFRLPRANRVNSESCPRPRRIGRLGRKRRGVPRERKFARSFEITAAVTQYAARLLDPEPSSSGLREFRPFSARFRTIARLYVPNHF